MAKKKVKRRSRKRDTNEKRARVFLQANPDLDGTFLFEGLEMAGINISAARVVRIKCALKQQPWQK